MGTLTATVTGKAGPADSVTAQVLTNVTSMELVPGTNLVRFKFGTNQTLDLDILAATTFTVTISSTNFTVTIS